MTTTIYDAERSDISIAVGGDAMITRRMRAFQEPRFLKLVDILRGADVSLVNLEMLFHDYESSWQWSSATYTRSDPRNLDELKWMGIDAVTTANNHSFDFSEGGFLTTLEHCREIDLAYAGGGRNLDEARSPTYVDSARGRVAVMGATSTFSEQSRAGAGRPDFAGRPGVNALRHDITHHAFSTPCTGPTWSWGTRRSTLSTDTSASGATKMRRTTAPKWNSWTTSSSWTRSSPSAPL